jgi:hypothetical protein
LLDLGLRSIDLQAHYGDHGVFPLSVYLERYKNPFWLSLHLAVPDSAKPLLFVVAALFAVALVLGYRTRLVTVILWALTVSLHSTNYLVAQSGDTALRHLLFWGMFLPLGARWSLDATRHRRPSNDTRPVATGATFAIVVQLLLVYGFTASHKLGHSVWRKGEAVYYALSHEAFTTQFGTWFSQFTGPLSLATWATPVLQLVVVVLVPLTWKSAWVRVLVALAMIGMHVTFMLFLHLGLFSFVMIVWWLAMLPGTFYDRLLPRRAKAPSFVPRIPPCTLASALALSVFVYSAYWNFRNTPVAMPEWLEVPARILRLEQNWAMFSNPPRHVEWIYGTGRLENGEVVNVFEPPLGVRFDAEGRLEQSGPPTALGPTAAIQYSTQRWRKYFSNISNHKFRRHRKLFAAYLCRTYNADRPPQERVEQVEVHVFRYDVSPPGERVDPSNRRFERKRWAKVKCTKAAP